MGYNAAGDWVPDEDLTNVSKGESSAPSTASIDDQIASTQKDIAATKERIRIANQSLKNIDPKYEMNQPYIKKLNTQIATDQTQLDLLESRLSSLQKEKENATAKKPTGTTNKNTVKDEIPEVVVTDKRPEKKDTSKRTYNPLGKFSSYTYRLSLYMMTAEALNLHNTTGVWNKQEMFLVAQSAGTGEKETRAPGFQFDYYIDNLDITHMVAARSAGFNGNSIEIKFDIYEPYGMTFPTRLLGAAKQLEKRTSFPNVFREQQAHMGTALTQYYLLVVKFYGYDSNGNLVKTPLTAQAAGDKTDDPGLYERTYPIIINDMVTRLDNRMVKYAISATPITERVSQSQYTGAIQEPLTIIGDTVGDILSDSTTSLVAILNKKEQELVKAKKKEIPNIYKIEFEDLSPIENARLVDKNTYQPARTPMMGVPGAVNVRVANSGKASTVSKNKRSIQIPAGTRIPQAIEQIVSQSTYITECLATIDKEEIQPVQEGDNDSVTNPNPNEFAWFVVIPKIQKIGVNKELQTGAFEITYKVIKYDMPFIRSPYFTNKSKYPGPSKIYNYWYTGQNESVLSFDITYNSLYYGIATAYNQGTIKNNDNIPMAIVSQAGGDTQGKVPGTAEGVSTFKSWLYSPDDTVTANLKILGDPDFMMTAPFGTFDEMLSKDLGDEAPINPVLGQVFIEVGLNSVEDFDESTGLMKPEANIRMWPQSPELEKITNGRMVFNVVSVRSRFVRGQFTQELSEMTLPTNIDNSAAATDSKNGTGREESAGAGRGKQGGPSAADLANAERAKAAAKDPRRTDAEDENNFVTNNTHTQEDNERAFIGYRKPTRRTNKQNTTGE